MTGGKRKESKKERSCRESNPSPLTWVTSIVNTKLQTPALTILRMHCTGSTDCLCHTPGSYSLCAIRTWLLEVNCKSFSVRREPMAWATSVVISGHWSFLIPFSTFINWLMSSQAPHVSMKKYLWQCQTTKHTWSWLHAHHMRQDLGLIPRFSLWVGQSLGMRLPGFINSEF